VGGLLASEIELENIKSMYFMASFKPCMFEGWREHCFPKSGTQAKGCQLSKHENPERGMSSKAEGCF